MGAPSFAFIAKDGSFCIFYGAISNLYSSFPLHRFTTSLLSRAELNKRKLWKLLQNLHAFTGTNSRAQRK